MAQRYSTPGVSRLSIKSDKRELRGLLMFRATINQDYSSRIFPLNYALRTTDSHVLHTSTDEKLIIKLQQKM